MDHDALRSERYDPLCGDGWNVRPVRAGAYASGDGRRYPLERHVEDGWYPVCHAEGPRCGLEGKGELLMWMGSAVRFEWKQGVST